MAVSKVMRLTQYRSIVTALLSLIIFLGFMAQLASTQTVPKPSVTEFSLKCIDESYDIAPTTTSSTDEYTGEVTTTTTPGYHVDRRIIQITIENNLGASYYNFRYKGAYGSSWTYYPFNPDDINGYSLHNTPAEAPPYPASTSDYTIAKLYLPTSVPNGVLVDVQVQGLFGDFRKVHEGSIGAMMLGYNTTYNYYFTGQAGDWSNTQTVTIGETSTSTSPAPTALTTSTPITSQTPTVTPIAPDTNGDSTNLITLPLEIFVIIVAVVVLLAVALSVSLFRRHRKTVNQSK